VEESLALKTARSHVDSFQGESRRVMSAHREAMDCRDCEAFLQLGIDAFDWIMRVDQGYRTAVFEGHTEYSSDVDQAIRTLCEAWLPSAIPAEKWVELQLARGYTLANLDRFRQCHREMAAIVRAFAEQDSGATLFPTAIAALSDEAAQEHLDGQTAEFI
jgi:hypothetical protein